LLKAGQPRAVVASLAVFAQFEYPGSEEYTDAGRNPSSPAGFKAAILAGEAPQFPATPID